MFDNLSPDEKIEKYSEYNNGFMGYENAAPAKPIVLTPKEEDKKTPTTVIDAHKAKVLELLRSNPPKKKEVVKTPENASMGVEDMVEEWNSKIPGFDIINKFKGKNKVDFDKFEKAIRMQESSNNPKADNPNSTAVGYYQFLWGKKPGQGWGDSIKKVTGIQTADEFKANPEAQKKYFRFYYDTHILPQVEKIKKSVPNTELDDFAIGKLIHFQGAAGALNILKKGALNTKTQSYNPTPMEYIKNNS